MIFSSFIPTLIKGYLKSKYIKINELFLVLKPRVLFIGAGTGAESRELEPVKKNVI